LREDRINYLGLPHPIDKAVETRKVDEELESHYPNYPSVLPLREEEGNWDSFINHLEFA
jgi:hypothetical protein